MKINWQFIPLSLGLMVGCAAPHADRGLTFKAEAVPPTPFRARVTDEELRKFLTDTGDDPSVTATAHALKAACDAVLWNIENADTPGFRKILVRLEGGLWDCSARSFAQGELIQTKEALDVAILGPGFLELELPDGTKAYTREGSLRLQLTDRLVSAQGYVLTGMAPLPCRDGTIAIASDGTVTHQSSNGSATSWIRVVDFPNPSGLALNSEGMFIATPASGRAEVVQLGDSSAPARTLVQGYLELSNVHLVEEVVSLMRLMEWKRSVRGLVSVADVNSWAK